MTHPVHQLTRAEANELYAQVLADRDAKAMRELCLKDLWFLLTIACRRQDMNTDENGKGDWLYARCREVEQNPDGFLDVWSREHYKSTIITFGLTIKDLLNDPELTFGLFSHTRPIAKSFLRQIKYEFEANDFLKGLFPDVLYAEPQKESPSWSLDNGITVRRKSNPKECSVEAFGVVDGQPTSRHYRALLYDDLVTLESVSSPDMIAKTTDAWALSLNLGADGGKIRTVGTYYHITDSYKEMERRGAVKVRLYPATVDGTPDGRPVILTKETLETKRRQMGPYVFACQMLLNPVADNTQGFKDEWIQYYDGKLDPRGMNVYLLVDPANEKKKENDYSVLLVIGLGSDGNYYLLDAVRDRLNLTQRSELVMTKHRQYHPLKVAYEKYGMQSDTQHIRYLQNERNYRFPILEVGGNMPKNDRIRRLIAPFSQGRFYLPRRLMFRDAEGRTRDFTMEFVNDEFRAFPVAGHDDMLDCMARILDPLVAATFPSITDVSHRWRETRTLSASPAVSAHDRYDVLAGIGELACV